MTVWYKEPVTNYLTQQQALKVIEETYTMAEVPEEDWWTPSHWLQLTTGWVPVFLNEMGGIAILWSVILEHGRIYIREIQEFPGDTANQLRMQKAALSCVGGSHPW
jgi:hypothetical protein